MKISKPDFLVLNLQGIDMFVDLVDGMVGANPGATFEPCARELQRRIREYSGQRDTFKSLPTMAALARPLTLSVGELLDPKTCRLPAFRGVSLNVVYIVRNGDAVMYVGSTRYNARTRMKSHAKSHSPLGEALRKNPQAQFWLVEMIPHADYREAAAKEKQLIASLSPLFCRRI